MPGKGEKLFKIKNNVTTNPGGYKFAIFTFRFGNQMFYNHQSSWVQKQLAKQNRGNKKSDDLCDSAHKVHERMYVNFQWQKTEVDNTGGGLSVALSVTSGPISAHYYCFMN